MGCRPGLFIFCSPARYTQGRGATAALGSEMEALGLEGPALLIAGKTVISHLAAIWKTSLDNAAIHHEVHRFAGECSLAEIARSKSAAQQLGARTIIGAGGGKVLDTAPRCRSGSEFARYQLPNRRVKRRALQCSFCDLHRGGSLSGIPILP